MASLPEIVSLNPPVNVADFLVSEGIIKQSDVERALLVSNNDLLTLGPLLVRLGFVSDKDLAGAYSKVYRLPLLEENALPQFPVNEDNLSIKFIKEARLLPLSLAENQISLAISNPEDLFSLKAVEMATSRTLDLKVGTLSQIERGFDQLYGQARSSMSEIVDQIETNDEANEIESIDRLRDLAAEAPIIRLVNLIIDRALETRASDVHIEPFENSLKVRYRIDGVLHETESPPAHSTAAIISRIKIMAKLNIAEHRLPQDGRIQLRTQGKLIDLRVSTVPTLHGESMVLRILDKQHIALDLNTLGFDNTIITQFEKLIKLPHGIILVTGPTGSGKTTTLYAALQRLNTSEKKILTVEDPAEYQLEGINQIQVKPQIGLDFSHALRSIVRQDPDIIMIGEMRDLETARIAIQSALTGHLVFSTLHTNDAGSSITRMLDMGVEDYLLTSTLNGILAQRLLRTLCKQCKETYQPILQLREELQLHKLITENEIQLYKAVGCRQCTGSGYHGRTTIAELLVLSEPVRRLILSHADGKTIQHAAVESGMITMKEDGLKKALLGSTTIEEVTRVTQDA